MTSARPKTDRVVWGLASFVVLPLALAHIAALTYVLARRLTYPMDLEWLEGQQIYEAYRFIHGLPVYGPPTQGFVPSPYPPLHFMSMGVIGLVTGLDYWTGRFVSDAAIASVVVLQALVFLRSTTHRWLALALSAIAAGGVNVAYQVLSSSMDIARADSLAFGLAVAAAFVVGRRGRGWSAAAGLSVLLALGVYAKQNNVLYYAWLLLWLARRDVRQAARVVGLTALLGGAALGALQWWTHGWFWTWLTEMSHHPFMVWKWKPGATFALAASPLLVATPVLAGVLLWRGALRDETQLWLGMLVMAVPACLIPYLADGGWVNNLIAVAVLGWFVPLLLALDLLRLLQTRPAVASWMALGASAGLALLLWHGAHDPTQFVPGAERTRQAEEMHALVRSLDGDVLLPMYPFVVPRDGKTTPQPAIIPYLDAVNRGGVQVDIAQTMRDVHARWVILCGHDLEDGLMTRWLTPDYVVDRQVPLHVQAFLDETGHSMTVLRRVDAR